MGPFNLLAYFGARRWPIIRYAIAIAWSSPYESFVLIFRFVMNLRNSLETNFRQRV